jgi:hypothetical protein
VQGLKEIVSRPDAEIYAALRDCGMDPDEAVSQLLSQGPVSLCRASHMLFCCTVVFCVVFVPLVTCLWVVSVQMDWRNVPSSFYPGDLR